MCMDKVHEYAVLKYLNDFDGGSAKDISVFTHISPPNVRKILLKLIREKRVETGYSVSTRNYSSNIFYMKYGGDSF